MRVQFITLKSEVQNPLLLLQITDLFIFVPDVQIIISHYMYMTWLYVGTWRVFWTRRREVKPDLFRTPTRFCLCDPISRINVWHARFCKPTECYVSLGSWCSVHVQENITSLALNTLVTTETAVNVSRCFCCSLVGCNDELRRHGGNFFSRLMDFVSTFSLFGLQPPLQFTCVSADCRRWYWSKAVPYYYNNNITVCSVTTYQHHYSYS